MLALLAAFPFIRRGTPKKPPWSISAIPHAAVEYAHSSGYARALAGQVATQNVSGENRQEAYGHSQVSDKAKPAVLLMRSPRGSGKG
jgi:hypothetical protein